MRTTRKGWFQLASGAGIGRIGGIASNLLLSRWLGPSELGLFNLVTTTVQTSDTLARCGGDYALNFELGGQTAPTKTERGASLSRGLSQLCSLTTGLICIGVAIWNCWGDGLFPRSLVAGDHLMLTCLLLLMVACEGVSASAWEVLLVNHKTGLLALRQGLFFPLRLMCAAVGALFGGIWGAMGGWSLVAISQCMWLKVVLGPLWKPLQIWPLLTDSLRQLLRRGFPFYASNLLASMVFYPLLLKVADGSGLSEIGYLRVGQILQQIFAFLPATLVPILFLKLRGEATFADQVSVMERPLRVIWFLLLEALLIYCMVDQSIVAALFGKSYMAAILPTRLLLITALFECLAQLVVQPVLATGRTRLYGYWQNGAAILSAVVGWLCIPATGLAGYLIVRLLYVVVPLIGFGVPVCNLLREPQKVVGLLVGSMLLLVVLMLETINGHSLASMNMAYFIAFALILVFQWEELTYIRQALRFKS